jgi:hypothetical protein
MSWSPDGSPLSIIAFTVTEGRITGIHIVVDPAKLVSIHLPPGSVKNERCNWGSWLLTGC